MVLEGNHALASQHFRNAIAMLKSMLTQTIVKAVCNSGRKAKNAMTKKKTGDNSCAQSTTARSPSLRTGTSPSIETQDTVTPNPLLSSGFPQEYSSSLLASQHLHICARPVKLCAKTIHHHTSKDDFRHRNMASAVTFNLALSYHLLSCLEPPSSETSRYRGHAISLYSVAFKLLNKNGNHNRNHSGGNSPPPQSETFAIMFLFILNNLGILHHQAGNTASSRYFFTRLSLQLYSGGNDCQETTELIENLVKVGFARASLPSAAAA